MNVKIIKEPVKLKEVEKLAQESFGDLIKGVVDIEKEVMAVGGEMHSDANEVLIEEGSQQEDLWGFNIYLDREREDWIEYISLINIRPQRGNKSMEVEDQEIRLKMSNIINRLIK